MRFITEWLDAWADVQPEKKLFGFIGSDGSERDSFNYVRFARHTRRLAAWLNRKGLRRGDRAVLAYPAGLDMIAAFFACARAGIIAVPTARPPSGNAASGRGSGPALTRITAIAADSGAQIVLTDRAPAEYVTGTALRWLGTAGCKSDADLEDDATAASFADTPSRALFLQYTSGATGDPRGVIVSHGNIVANARAVLGDVAIGTEHSETGVSWLPQHHDMGLIGYYLFPVIVGGTTIGMSPLDFLRRPALWLQTIARVRGTYASAPNFGFEHCLRPGRIADDELAGVDLGSLRWLMSAAEPVRPETLERFAARFATFGLRPETCVSAYGLAENTLAATHHGRRTLALDAAALRHGNVRPVNEWAGPITRLASCGAPLPGVQLRIVDPQTGLSLPERTIGEIWLAGASACDGYWGAAASEGNVFGQHIAGDPTPWLRTGDLGFTEGGELYVCGRIKDVIIVRGANHHPQDIEAAAERVAAVKPGACVAFSDGENGLTVMAETALGRNLPDPATIAHAVQMECGVLPGTVMLVRPGSIVRTTSGKLARSSTRERLASGGIAVLQEWRPQLIPDSSTLEALRALAASLVAQLGTDAKNATLAEIGLDSLMLTELSLSLDAIARRMGAPRLASEFDIGTLQRLSIARLLGMLDALEQGGAAALGEIVDELGQARDQARAATATQMRADARLEPSTTAAATVLAQPVSDVVMTGATGFFGPFLLSSLLRRTDWRFHLLVRATDEDHAQRRVETALAGAGVLPIAVEHGLYARVSFVRGDVTLPGWGLEPETWRRLAVQANGIVHNAAAVNWLATYETLKPANVDGTRTMLRLAQTGTAKRVHHISSTFVFGWTVRELLLESDTNAAMANLDFGYAQSKWVAEQLVLAARRQGVNARIYRPAIISASLNGKGHPADAAIRVLAFMINHGIAVETANQLSILPADVAAENIAAIIAQDEPPGETFHVTTDYYNIVDLTRALTAAHGYQFVYHDIPSFIAEMNRRCTRADPLYPLLDFFNNSADRIAAMQLKRYGNANYRAACVRSRDAVAQPSLSSTAAAIVAYLRAEGLVPESAIEHESIAP